MNGLSQAARDELESLRLEKGGTLRPADVVEQARSPNSALHPYFDWDDTVAAARYREHQARGVIRAVVKLVPGAHGHPVALRAYVSLPDDRAARTGYRATVEVMSDEALAAQALQAFAADVERLRAKYGAYLLAAPAIDAAVGAALNTLKPQA